MTFETAIGFLRSATIEGKKGSPSVPLILHCTWETLAGRNISFKIMQKLSLGAAS
ncbi:DNA-directed RNA polymerase subunit [Caligus rogercresseyi]|uniref:DNA-directed RNA polymerase subunit n=1 Tax=Caligus rogercresseyi TaxID=217165 RepID=A0A7T8GMB4_CALRO|nr:DNA-directed RNA polymerase subunit [Caligus rogercresseyi]